MNEDYTALIDEFIKIELNVAELYLLFHELFPQDADFWWQLLIEEKNHASLIRSIQATKGLLDNPVNLIFTSSLKDLNATNSRVCSIIKKFKDKSPSRYDAFNIALGLEESAGELHYQEFMVENYNSEINSIFKKLNAEDKDHAKRIRAYMEEHDI